MAASVLWALSFILWGVGVVVDNAPVRSLSILVVAGAATLTIRCYFIKQGQVIKSAMAVTSTVSRLHH